LVWFDNRAQKLVGRMVETGLLYRYLPDIEYIDQGTNLEYTKNRM